MAKPQIIWVVKKIDRRKKVLERNYFWIEQKYYQRAYFKTRPTLNKKFGLN